FGVKLKLLIIGCSGVLGSKLLEKYSSRYQTLGTFYSSAVNAYTQKNVVHLDITQHLSVEQFVLDFNPDVIIYAASHSVTRPTPEDSKKFLQVNFEGLKNISSVCSSFNKKI